jgi:organic radical activating enzyme
VVDPDKTVENFVKPCSLIRGDDWQIVNNNISASRNNPQWKTLRQQFLDGRLNEIKECEVCVNAERAGSSSPRQLNNEYLFDELDVDIMAELANIINNNLECESVYALDYMPSNYCNLACVMCYSGASSQRFVFDLKQGRKIKYQINDVENDFYNIIRHVKILGFTGGETIQQPEVQKIIDYLIDNNLSQYMTITILTNATDFSDALVEKFRKFKKVLYTVSIDGVGEVIEYQRRGADWPTIQRNAKKIHACPVVHEFINHVVTSVNILNAMDFIDWCHSNDLKYIGISAVFQQHLGVAALPLELRELALSRLCAGRHHYEHYLTEQYTNNEKNYVLAIDRLISMIENTPFSDQALQMFVSHIKLENTASKKALHKVVPEWAPWFSTENPHSV